ncbi:hypothetical protein P4S94_01600 [Aeribacillus composti]|nr:hypothetical protein [Aeribacillus composti]
MKDTMELMLGVWQQSQSFPAGRLPEQHLPIVFFHSLPFRSNYTDLTV